MAHRGKTVMLIIGKDIIKQVLPLTERNKFENLSKYYGEFYVDEDGEESHMGDFTGDDIFPERTELMKFGGETEDNWGEFDILDDAEVYVRYYKKFNQADKDKWNKIAEEVGHPEQVIFRLGWNSKTSSKFTWEDFDY